MSEKKIAILLEKDQTKKERSETTKIIRNIKGIFSLRAAYPGHEFPPEKDAHYATLEDGAHPPEILEQIQSIRGVQDAHIVIEHIPS